MGFWDDVWSGIKKAGEFVYDSTIKPIVQPSQANLMKAGENWSWLGSKVGQGVKTVQNILSSAQKIPLIGEAARTLSNTISPVLGVAGQAGDAITGIGSLIQDAAR